MIGSGVGAKSLHGARVCIIPRPENNYEPLALRRGPLAFISSLLISAKMLVLLAIVLTPVPAELSVITANRIVELTNKERVAAGLPALKVNQALTEAATEKAKDMLENDYFAHISPAGVTPWFWMKKAGYEYRVAGENLAIDFTEVEDVVTAWMASQSHKDNIMQEKYVETGVGVLTGEYLGGNSTVVVHFFGLPLVSPAPESTPEPASVIGGEAVAGETINTPAVEPTAAPEPESPPVKVPRISLAGSSEAQGEAGLLVSGEEGTTVKIEVNGVLADEVIFDSDATVRKNVDISSEADGRVLIRAYAMSKAGEISRQSEELAVNKDTSGPMIARDDLSFVMSPATDYPRAVLKQVPNQIYSVAIDDMSPMGWEADWLALEVGEEPLAMSFFDGRGNVTRVVDISLGPAITIEREISYLSPPAKFGSVVRKVAIAVIGLIIFLLFLAVLIKINIQRPRMIAKAGLVLLIAAVVLWL